MSSLNSRSQQSEVRAIAGILKDCSDKRNSSRTTSTQTDRRLRQPVFGTSLQPPQLAMFPQLAVFPERVLVSF